MTDLLSIGPEGPLDATLAIVAERPGPYEVENLLNTGVGRPLIGSTGRAVDRHLNRVGTSRAQTYLRNAVQRFPLIREGGRIRVPTPRREDIEAEQLELYRDLLALPNLRCIVAMGNVALAALSNFHYADITRRRGSVLESFIGIKMVPTFHPSFYMRGEWRFAPVVEFDLKRAWEESQTDKLPWPTREFLIRPTLKEALDAIDEMTNSKYVSYDIEIVSRNLACLALSNDPHFAVCIPFTWGNRVSYWTPEEEAVIWLRLNAMFLSTTPTFISQNGLFDAWWLWKYGLVIPNAGRGFDTMYAHALLAPDLPHRLDFITSIYTNEPYYKDESGSWAEPTVKIPIDQFWFYNCLRDDSFILTADLTWKMLRYIEVGDHLISIEENPSGQRYKRKLRLSTVTAKSIPVQKECFRISTSDGFLDATEDHKVFAGRKRDGFKWTQVKDLRPGDKLISTGGWTNPTTYTEGWMGGILDGEGCLFSNQATGSEYPNINVCQKEGSVLRRIKSTLEQYKFSFTEKQHPSETNYLYLKGGLTEVLRLLGTFRPERLISKFRDILESVGISGISMMTHPTITKITPIGVQTVLDISTTEGTFIANGFIVHNCKDASTTLEAALGLIDDMREIGIYDYYTNVIQPSWPALLDMRIRGLKVDVTQLSEMRQQTRSERQAAEEELCRLCNGWLPNVKSYLDMEKFFDMFKIQPKRTATGRVSTKEDHLNEYLYRTTNDDARRALALVLEVVERRTLESGFLNLKPDPSNYYHPALFPGTVTTRLRSSGDEAGGPQIQNIPQYTRRIFVAD